MEADRLYLVALSGGADSVALLLCLKELGYRVEAVHCNFRLRGEESDRDEDFCKRLCEKENVLLHITHYDTRSYASLHGISIEMAARNLRYSYFKQLREDVGAAGICVGHHMEDSVETMLLNIIRGTGIKGVTGIAAKNGHVIRPMLGVSRNEIECYLKRNKLRLDVMPLIRGINPSADKKMFETTRRVTEANRVFEHAIEKAAEDSTTVKDKYLFINIERLKRQVSPEYTLYHILSRHSFSSATIDDIFSNLDNLKNGSIFSSDTHRLVADRGFLVIERNENKDSRNEKPFMLPESGTYIINETTKVRIKEETIEEEFTPSRSQFTISADASKVKFPLRIRRWTQGDWFIPFGMTGKKLVSDYLTDRKMAFFDKEKQLVMTDAENNILWLIGQRLDNRLRISENTKKILTIEFICN